MGFKKFKTLLLAAALAFTSVVPTGIDALAVLAATAAFVDAQTGGASETIYATISGITASQVTEVSYSGGMSGKLGSEDLKYLVRDIDGKVRIDIPGIKGSDEGTAYTLTVKTGSTTLTKSGIKVYSYDRSGYAHFKYTDGVGAYKDDGTIKDNAIVLYVTDENKNDVTLTVGSTTVHGIGNILNSAGAKSNNGSLTNSNKEIIKSLSSKNIPLVVRFVGCVSETGLYERGAFDATEDGLIDGLTAFNSYDYGGTYSSGDGDNGHLARIKSGKNITLEGIGYDATLDGWGFHFIAESGTTGSGAGRSFEVRNLNFINTPEDGIGMEGAQSGTSISAPVERCWVHNNSFYCPNILNPAVSDKAQGDGSVDFKRGEYFTCSYNYFEGCHKTNLVGANKDSLQYNLTYHHNYWYRCEARGPLSRRANIHMYNNVSYGQSSYSQNARANAYIFSEYNQFFKCNSPQLVKTELGASDKAAIKSYNDTFASCIGDMHGKVVSNRSDYVDNACAYASKSVDYSRFETNSSLSYIASGKYLLDTDMKSLRKRVLAMSGVQKQIYKLPGDITDAEISLVDSDVINNGIVDLPHKITTNTKIAKQYVFKVTQNVDVTVSYSSNAATTTGILLDEFGEVLLSASGTVKNLPAGTYIIQGVNFNPKDLKFKDLTITSLSVVANTEGGATGHVHKYVKDSSAGTAATCETAGTEVYKCVSATGECDAPTRNETIAALGHSYSSSYTIDVEPTTESTGSKSRHCTRSGCTAKTSVTVIPALTENPGGGESGGGEPGGGEAGGGETSGSGRVHNFTESAMVSDFYTFTGAMKSSPPAMSYKDLSLTEAMKLESATEISFTAPGAGKLIFVTTPNISTKVNGTSYTADSEGVVEVEVSAGTVVIKKGGTGNIYYIEYIQSGITVDTPTEPENKECTHSSYSEVTVEATCTRNGETYKQCNNGDCNYIFDKVIIPATGHSEEIVEEAIEPTCTQTGKTAKYVCDVCGTVTQEATTLAAKGHSYSAWTTTVLPTATTDGSKFRKCSSCGNIQTQAIAATGVEEETTTGEISIKEQGGYQEGAYVSWLPYSDGKNVISYRVFVGTSASSFSSTPIDDPLIRRYQGFYRADVVGLKAGTYYLKIEAGIYNKDTKKFTPVDGGSKVTSAITVTAHDRSGYAFVNEDGSTFENGSVGAYKADGTLKDNANVVYITNDNKESVKLTVQTGSKSTNVTECTGIRAIMLAYKKGYETKPLDIRIIGNIDTWDNLNTDSSFKGDWCFESNKTSIGYTIEGIGSDTVANGWGIRLKNATNVEIRNIGFMNCSSDEGDNIGLQQDVAHAWVHNCDMFYGNAGSDKDQIKGDGALDCKKSTMITFSYNHFWDNGKCNLLGLSEGDAFDGRITYHHNWYDHSDSRHPRIRYFTTHVYNNYYEGNAKYGIGSTLGSSVFAENNYFDNCKYPMLISYQGSDIMGSGTTKDYGNLATFSGESGGIIKAYGNYMTGQKAFRPYSSSNKTQFDAYVASSRNEKVPDTVVSNVDVASDGKSMKDAARHTYNNFDTEAAFYSYTPDAAADVPAIVTAKSGRVNGGEPILVGSSYWTHVNYSGDDEEYLVYQPLKKAVTDYKTSILQIGGLTGTVLSDDDIITPVEPGEGEEEPVTPVITYYSVTFNANGHGSAPSKMTNIISGSTITAPTNPAATGYTFGGWYKEAACTNKWTFASDKVTSDVTLYAKWTAVAPSTPGEDAPVTGDYTYINLTGGLAVGTEYGVEDNLSIQVMADMAYQDRNINVDGQKYTKMVQGTANPAISNNIPTGGSVFKLVTGPNTTGAIRMALASASSATSTKTLYFIKVDGTTATTLLKYPYVAGQDYLLEQNLEADSTYYVYVSGSKIMVGAAGYKYTTTNVNTQVHVHTPQTVAAVNPTCTQSGLTGGSVCSECGAVLTAQMEVAKLGHDMSGWVTVTEATALTDGTKKRTCQRDGCGYTEIESIPATGAPATSGEYVSVDLSKNLAIGTEYGADGLFSINVLDGFKTSTTNTTVGGETYKYTSQGQSDPNPNKGDIPTTGAAIKIETKDTTTADLKVVVTSPYNPEKPSSKTLYLVKAVDGAVVAGSTPIHTFTDTNPYIITQPLDPNATYYCYLSGSKIKVAYIGYRAEGSVHQHTPVQVKGKAATCTEDGLTDGYKCQECGESIVEQETIAKLGHNEVNIAAVAATCTTAGYTAGVRCTRCNEVLSGLQTEAALGHDMTDWITVTEATATAEGLKRKTCRRSGCSYAEIGSIPATGEAAHIHTQVLVKGKSATCTQSGLTDGYKCSECEAVLVPQETIAPLGHNETDVAAIPATCTKAGKTAGKRCTRCSSIVSGCTTVEALGHTENVIPAVEATCTTKGKTAGIKCSVCGIIIKEQTETPTLDHTEEVIPAVAATCTEGGKTSGVKCSVCKEILTAPTDIAALGHDMPTEWTIDLAATETSDGLKTKTCKRQGCNHSIAEIIPATGEATHSHTPVVVKGKEPTCTEDGLSDGYKCSECQATLKAQTKIDKLGHDEVNIAAIPATCTVDGKTAGKRCARCNTITSGYTTVTALGHDLPAEWEVVKAPTKEETGLKRKTCQRQDCDYEVTEVIDKLTDSSEQGCTHTPITVVKVPATCTTPGTEAGTQCSKCFAILSGCEPIEALGHDWSVFTVITDADYNHDGLKEKTCKREGCQEKITEIISKPQPISFESKEISMGYSLDAKGKQVFDMATFTPMVADYNILAPKFAWKMYAVDPDTHEMIGDAKNAEKYAKQFLNLSNGKITVKKKPNTAKFPEEYKNVNTIQVVSTLKSPVKGGADISTEIYVKLVDGTVPQENKVTVSANTFKTNYDINVKGKTVSNLKGQNAGIKLPIYFATPEKNNKIKWEIDSTFGVDSKKHASVSGTGKVTGKACGDKACKDKGHCDGHTVRVLAKVYDPTNSAKDAKGFVVIQSYDINVQTANVYFKQPKGYTLNVGDEINLENEVVSIDGVNKNIKDITFEVSDKELAKYAEWKDDTHKVLKVKAKGTITVQAKINGAAAKLKIKIVVPK